jgi:hypothetical protein
MKKILLFLGISSIVIGAHAQSTGITANPNKMTPAKQPLFNKEAFKANKGIANQGRAESFWLNYATSMDEFQSGGTPPGPAVLNSNYLFPDSLCFGEFGAGNFSGIWIHHLGDMLDVTSTVFGAIDGLTWTDATPYSVDSMAINYAYTRMDANPAVIDTLIVTMFTNATAANNPGYYFTGATATTYGTDTLSFKAIKYTQASNTVNATGKYTFKVLLDGTDTAVTFYREKAFAVPVPVTVGAGKLLTTDIQFKPGYAYALGDQIDYVHNAFFFTSYEENGDATYPTFFDCNNNAPDCDYNVSHILPQDVRYNTAGTWNNLFIPSYAYTQPYAFEHHLISYKVTNPPVSVNEYSTENFTLGQNHPNPSNGQTTISYNLRKAADKVSLAIYDVRGVKVYENNTSNVKAGTYSVEVKNVNFTAGMYFYALEVDGARIAKKMIVE